MRTSSVDQTAVKACHYRLAKAGDKCPRLFGIQIFRFQAVAVKAVKASIRGGHFMVVRASKMP